MRRGWKIVIGIVVMLAVLLAVNTIVVDGETKDPEVTVEGGQILELPGGDVQVTDEGSPGEGPPIVLLHCYSCSLHWFDGLAPILAENHRVIRIDLLGHGGSQKPTSGYEIEEQAALVAGALDQLEVEGAVVVGHSMGFAVATALAESASQLVDRVVNIGEGPDEGSCSLPLIAKLSYAPVLGEAMWRLVPSFAIEDGYASVFAPGYETSKGFPNTDQIIDDHRAMTYSAFRDAHAAAADFVEEMPLDQRLQQTAVPLLSIFGSEDQICDPAESQAAYEAVPGARLAEIEGAGHSPNVEKPERTAALIEEFAADAAAATVPPAPREAGQQREQPRRGSKQRRN